MGTAPIMDTRWRSPTLQLPAGSQIEIIKVSYATKHHGRKEFEKGMDQRWTNGVMRGGVR